MDENLKNLQWRKASASASQGNCLMVSLLPSGTRIAVGDSKNPDGPVLLFNAAEWAAFLDGAKAGEFDDMFGGEPR